MGSVVTLLPYQDTIVVVVLFSGLYFHSCQRHILRVVLLGEEKLPMKATKTSFQLEDASFFLLDWFNHLIFIINSFQLIKTTYRF